MKYSFEEKEAILELRKVLGSERTRSEREAISELKKALLPETPVDDIKSAFGSEFLKVVDSLVSEEKPKELKVVSDRIEVASFDFLGVHDKEPKNAKPLSLYRNSVTRTVYIYKDGWKEFLKDGEATNSYVGGGGLGEEEVLGLIQTHGGASSWESLTDKPTTVSGFGIVDVYTKAEVDEIVDNIDVGFSGTLDADKVNVDYSSFVTLVGTNAQTVFGSIDRQIAGKVVLGEYKTHDMFDEGDIIYVGAMNVSGGWYFKKVVTDEVGNINLTYANNYSTSTNYDYSGAVVNKYTLNYVSLNELGLG